MLPTYRYLDRAIRLGPLTIAQWIMLVVAIPSAMLLTKLLTIALPSDVASSIAITIAGSPLAISYAADDVDFNVGAYARAALDYVRAPRLLQPGCDPSNPPRGYVLHARGTDTPTTTGRAAALPVDQIGDLWC